MATVKSDTVQRLTRVDTSKDRTVSPYQKGGRRRIAYGKATVNNAAVNDVVQLAWVPYGATITAGRVATSALGANVQLTVGTLAAGSVVADTDADKFATATAAATAVQIGLPLAALDAANLPYTVTDPAGAYLTATITNANTAATDQTIKGYLEFVLD
jgi:hypothetical protein